MMHWLWDHLSSVCFICLLCVYTMLVCKEKSVGSQQSLLFPDLFSYIRVLHNTAIKLANVQQNQDLIKKLSQTCVVFALVFFTLAFYSSFMVDLVLSSLKCTIQAMILYYNQASILRSHICSQGLH